MNTRILKKPGIFHPLSDLDLKKTIDETTAWIQSNEILTPYGKVWKQSPGSDVDYDNAPYFTKEGMYSGAAGIGFYFLRLFEATKEEKWIAEAKLAADHIIGVGIDPDFYTVKPEDTAGLFKIAAWTKGFHTGPTGGGFFCEKVYQATGIDKYREHAIAVADQLLDIMTYTEQGAYWTGVLDLSADGGFIMYLVYMYRETGEQKYLDAAVAGTEYIKSTTVKNADGSNYWFLIDASKMGIGHPEGTILPNFMHGTAGVAYLFAVLYEETGKEEYLALAKGAAAYIESIALGNEDAAVIPYLDRPGEEPLTDIIYLGFCHGPAGTAIPFQKLYHVTKDKHYQEFAKKLSRGIIAAGAPEKRSKGYWNTDCYCCGAAGMLEHFLNVYEATGEEEFLTYAKRTGAVLLGDSFEADGLRRWYTAWRRLTPWDVESYTGLYSGAAGIAAALLRLLVIDKGIKLSPFFDSAL